MSIRIVPCSPERFRVTGDLATDLDVPFDPDDDRFHLAFSDGTLIAGEHDPEEDRFHYVVEVEGAGKVTLVPGEVVLDWAVEWVTIGVYHAEHRTRAAPGPMPLFEPATAAADEGCGW